MMFRPVVSCWMWSRVMAGVLAAGTLLAIAGTARAQSDDERFGGGGPRGSLFSTSRGGLFSTSRGGLFGGYSSIAKSMVGFSGNYSPGTIVINTTERRLYYVMGNGQAIRYGIGVGRIGFSWAGTTAVSAKKEWPDWTPPVQMLARRPDLPRHMKGGIDNPLGARAMYLGSSLYRIHGSNEPDTIGTATSSGCFRMLNDDVVDLYDRVRVGAKVVVLR
jgi:lipoprotein-anchoring transpeptidase ErfK/SrfK